jgi:hypothetical protein
MREIVVVRIVPGMLARLSTIATDATHEGGATTKHHRHSA